MDLFTKLSDSEGKFQKEIGKGRPSRTFSST